MKTVVIPDLHEPPQRCLNAIERTIADEAPEQTVFLGDYFDRFGGGRADMERTAAWLKMSLETPGRVHLLGNHDAAYIWPVPATACPGWTLERQYDFDSLFAEHTELAERFQFHLSVDGWLLSHAGLAELWVPPALAFAEGRELAGWLEQEAQDARAAFAVGRWHWFAAQGPLRGGASPAGGLIWADWREKRYEVKQLFGHTPAPRVCRSENCVCIDTNIGGRGPQHYAVIENGELRVESLVI